MDLGTARGSGRSAVWLRVGRCLLHVRRRTRAAPTEQELEDQIVDLKNQRETLNTRIAREQRDKEVCQRDIRELRKELTELKAAAPAQ